MTLAGDIPKKIKVGWATVTVKVLSNEDWLEHDDLDDEDGGMFFPGSLEIYVRMFETMTKGVAQEILLHETLHALYHVSAVATGYRFLKKTDLEEFTVAALSGPLLAVMRENPKVLGYLLQADG